MGSQKKQVNKMSFKDHCMEASLCLQKLEELVNQMEEGMLLLEGSGSKDEEALVTALITLLGKASQNISSIREHLIMLQEDPGIAYAINVAVNELSRRAVNVRTDLDRHAQKPGARDSRSSMHSIPPN